MEVKIPAGIDSGQRLRVVGKGERGANGGPNGDLYLQINVLPDERFERQGKDILITIHVTAVDATIGTTIDVPTIHGEVSMKIPAGTQDGTILKLRGKGVPDMRGGLQGDELCTIEITIDKKLTAREKELYEELQELQNSNGKGSFWSKMKKRFN